MYFDMLKIRDFENAITDVYSRGLMSGLAHLYIGEEAIASGVCANITSKDYAVSTHWTAPLQLDTFRRKIRLVI